MQVQHRVSVVRILGTRLNLLSLSKFRSAYLLIAPFVLSFMLINVFSVVASFLLSLASMPLGGKLEFVRFTNYQFLLRDLVFWRSVGNTLVYSVIYVTPSIAISLGLALFVNCERKGVAVFRVLYYVPVITSAVINAVIWRWIYDPNTGLANHLLGGLGIPPQKWLVSRSLALPSISILSIWSSVGYNMVLYLAALQNIPVEYYEAALVDGANAWQRFSHITLPILKPTTFFIAVITTISALQVFTPIQLLTRGGPFYSTTTIVYYIYQNAFMFFRLGYASAIAYALCFLTVVISLIQRKYLGAEIFLY